MSNIILRVAFAKGSNELYCGFTKQGRITITGNILYSTDLVVSYYQNLIEIPADKIEGNVGTFCFQEDESVNNLIDSLNAIQLKRPKNSRSNKYPFLYLTLSSEMVPIFNKGDNNNPNRLTFVDVDVNSIIVNEVTPIEIIRAVSTNIIGRNRPLNSSTVDFRAIRSMRNITPINSSGAQTKAAASPTRSVAKSNGRVKTAK